MLKKMLSALLAFWFMAAVAAVDINKADQAALESVKGIGPGLSTRLLDERKKSAYKDWDDLIGRVKGVGEGNARRFSEAGLTVNGASYSTEPKPAKVVAPKASASKASAAGK
ncbi:ComEA family DNA-binding protein [Methylibium sp.]|jgi:competence protein ComEA|uniref:ComEA family DNA-binding protein n=1 Tax=Methylibium sp. TaxID=2067992 RepID=UPI003D1010C6